MRSRDVSLFKRLDVFQVTHTRYARGLRSSLTVGLVLLCLCRFTLVDYALWITVMLLWCFLPGWICFLVEQHRWANACLWNPMFLWFAVAIGVFYLISPSWTDIWVKWETVLEEGFRFQDLPHEGLFLSCVVENVILSLLPRQRLRNVFGMII